jgi:Tfp pilus assembly protein PilN
MIEINLLPPELKIKQAKAASFDPRYLVYLLPLVVGVLLFIHVALGMYALLRGYQLGALNRQWQKIAPQRQELDTFKKQYEAVAEDTKIAATLASWNINWSEKLNKLSLALPQGVWFQNLSVTPKELVLKGAVVSLEKQEMVLLNKFLDGLKKDQGFIKNFKSLEVTSFQVRTIGSFDTLEFTLTGKLQ